MNEVQTVAVLIGLTLIDAWLVGYLIRHYIRLARRGR